MKLYICIAIALVLSQLTIAQNNCINDVSTDPSEPVNSSLPTTNIQGSGTTTDDPRFLNGFDWTTSTDIPINGMQIAGPTMNFLHTNSQDNYYSYIYNGEAMTVDNGWELMLYNMGSFPDQSASLSVQNPDIPYIILYNRFTGILRIFAAYGDGYLPSGSNFRGVLVSVEFDDFISGVNGLFRLRDGSDEPLDKPTSNLFTKGAAFHQNSPKDWFSVDLQLAYDPCICYYPVDLKLKFEFLQSFELELYGRSIGVTDNIANGNELLTENFLSNFSAPGEESDDQIIMYKVMEDFVDDYIAKMQKYKDALAAVNEFNKELERKLVVAKLFKWAIVQGGGLTVQAMTGLPFLQPALIWAADLVTPGNANAEVVKKFKENLKKEASKILGQQVDTFIKKNFEKKEKPDKPNPPTASFTEMRMTGSLSNNLLVSGPTFFTPGSYGSEGTGSPTLLNQDEYPIYNNAVGTFALLNTPKLKAYRSEFKLLHEYNSVDYIEQPPTPPIPVYNGYVSWKGNYQFQLDNDIYYALNDINVLSHSVRVAVEMDVQPENNSNIGSNFFTYPSETINLTSEQVEVSTPYQIAVSNGKGFNNGKNYCSSALFNSSTCTYEQLDLPNTTYFKDTIKYSSPYFDIDAISPIVFSIGVVNDYFYTTSSINNFVDPATDGYRLNNFEGRFKVMVDVVFRDLDENGDNVTGTYMFTYDIGDIDWGTTALETDLQNSAVNYGSFKENLVLNTTDFDGSQVDGCKLVGTHYTCHGWEDVTVVGDLTTSNGHTVDIFGGENVFVVGESNVSPEIVMSIQSLLDLSDPMPKADGEFVNDFCKNKLGENFPSYSANTPNKSAVEELQSYNENNANESSLIEDLEVNLYPVPTSDLLQIHTSMELSDAQFVVLDLSGRVLDITIRKLSNQDFELNTTSLASGAYYLTISSNEGNATKAFTVIKRN